MGCALSARKKLALEIQCLTSILVRRNKKDKGMNHDLNIFYCLSCIYLDCFVPKYAADCLGNGQPHLSTCSAFLWGNGMVLTFLNWVFDCRYNDGRARSILACGNQPCSLSTRC